MKPKRSLKDELSKLTDRASPRANAVVQAVGAWIFSELSAVDCLVELEQILV